MVLIVLLYAIATRSGKSIAKLKKMLTAAQVANPKQAEVSKHSFTFSHPNAPAPRIDIVVHRESSDVSTMQQDEEDSSSSDIDDAENATIDENADGDAEQEDTTDVSA